MNATNKQFLKLHRFTFVLLLAIGLLAGLLSLPALAAPSVAKKAATKTSTSSSPAGQGQATGGASIHGYAADQELQLGTIVQLAKDNGHKVLPAVSKNSQQIYGVVVDPHLLSLTISDDSLKHEAFVATSGTYQVLVSDQTGPIKSGDYVALSDIDGVGMAAGNAGTTVLGRATGSFDGKHDTLGSAALKDDGGHTVKTVHFGSIPIAINIQRNPEEKSTKANLPNALQRVGKAVAEKPVSPVRIYLSAVIAALTVVVTIVMLYAGIRNSLISIGRNPLSKKAVFRGLIEVILASLVVLIIGLFAVYLLLKL